MVILSGKKALQKRIGDIRPIEKSIDEYIRSRTNYQVSFCYYDMPGKYRLKRAKKTAEAIREYVVGIERKIGDIDFLLLLGGDEVVPFFRLANPCDDADEWVLSDSPYASRDDNYTIPERVCARIPDCGSVSFMIKQLVKDKPVHEKSFGLSAYVWRRASEEVYRPIGTPAELKTSPPVTSDGFKTIWLQERDYLYFNVHGSKVSSSWYGQRGGEYPVAMQPGNIKKAGGVVASEACYGAYIINKNIDEAISLTFLEEDEILGFCGSTTIAYGPAQPPSGEADLLVKYFFEYARQGLTLGESFRNAKLDFARKAVRRHGFLDDDDQKTLLQFVLYGDPTLRAQKNVRLSDVN
jgi:hypothetical protein